MYYTIGTRMTDLLDPPEAVNPSDLRPSIIITIITNKIAAVNLKQQLQFRFPQTKLYAKYQQVRLNLRFPFPLYRFPRIHITSFFPLSFTILHTCVWVHALDTR